MVLDELFPLKLSSQGSQTRMNIDQLIKRLSGALWLAWHFS